jgi:DNA-binding NarL/FixJ family response regulator
LTPEPDGRRVLIVDDHSTFRLGLSALLGSEPGLDVVGEAATGREAVAAAAALRPDVTVMDLSMPDLNGIQATEQIIGARPDAGVLVLTMFDDEAHLIAAIRAGARGYLLKTARHQEIVRAVHAVGDGEIIFGQPLAARVRTFFTDSPVPAAHNGLFQLTVREREVLSLIGRGEGNADIARIMVVSPKTVRNYVTSIFRKLDVTGREQAIKCARAAGLA